MGMEVAPQTARGSAWRFWEQERLEQADRMGIRISPWGRYQGTGMPKPTYTYFVSQMKERWPNTAYLHVTEPRVDSGAELGPDGVDGKERDDECIPAEEENDFLRRVWSPRPFITAGGYTRELEHRPSYSRSEAGLSS
ncbi:hypothetical protein BDN71DRAFT_414279 [Pleurotus eryngii]|uniref:Uncharacterized protein n=1 Tax=Pleurotus eryngii TaxID=5323 RepID=A0A9P6A3K0_PLEER|nr:hypothetical protein BDN71DRAFT_414279 [Pleurotus eryngii]